MRAVAATANPHPAVTYLAGRAEAIPLPDASCDLAFLYFVLHHVEDRRAAGRELARVVRSGGTVCIRTLFSDRLGESTWRRLFPHALEVERAMFPSLAETTADLGAAGLEVTALDEVTFEIAASPAAHVARLRLRAISTFEHLSDEEVEEGLAAMERAAATSDAAPVVERGDLLVLGR